MNAYATAGWENFFVAQVGASAALTGLLFVAVSLNLKQILESPQLPGRAAEALVILLGVLAASTIGLVPGQSRTALGGELLATGVLVWIIPLVLQIPVMGQYWHRPMWIWPRLLATQLATVPLVVAAASLLAGRGGGLYWLVPAVILSIAAAVFDAWILLVEILR